MEALRKHIARTRQLFLASMAVYAFFFIVAFVMGLRGVTMDDQAMVGWIVPLILAVGVLPRSPANYPWPSSENPAVQDEIEMLRVEARHLQVRATYVRLVYILGAVFVIGLLPLAGL